MDKRLCASFASFDTISSDTLQYERTLIRTGYPLVAGLDEAGRGPLAGPVVAGCVILPQSCEFSRFKDSKVLTAAKRQSLYEYLHECGAYIGFAIVSPEEIDQVNILQASLLAMARSVSHLTEKEKKTPDFLLVDGKFTAPLDLPQKALIKGESKSASIAAASIIAKVVRDQLMVEYHQKFPKYNFARHKGYPTKAHIEALHQLGICPIHRLSFKPVKKLLSTIE
jgi:ribonuclease HII